MSCGAGDEPRAVEGAADEPGDGGGRREHVGVDARPEVVDAVARREGLERRGRERLDRIPDARRERGQVVACLAARDLLQQLEVDAWDAKLLGLMPREHGGYAADVVGVPLRDAREAEAPPLAHARLDRVEHDGRVGARPAVEEHEAVVGEVDDDGLALPDVQEVDLEARRYRCHSRCPSAMTSRYSGDAWASAGVLSRAAAR
jgi:hypothetical protein